MKKSEIFEKGKIIGVVLSVALVMATALGVTLAYHKTESNTAVNQFTVGNVTTELVEDFFQKTDTEFAKAPRVVNTGADPCLTRIKVTVTPESVQNRKVVDGNGNETGKAYLEISGFSGKWILKDDGYYYYSKVLQPGEATQELFQTVTVNYDDNNPWMDFDIILYHESVQFEATEGGETVTDPDKIWSLYESQKNGMN